MALDTSPTAGVAESIGSPVISGARPRNRRLRRTGTSVEGDDVEPTRGTMQPDGITEGAFAWRIGRFAVVDGAARPARPALEAIPEMSMGITFRGICVRVDER